MGNFTSPVQMRLALEPAIADKAFLDKIVADYFREHVPAELPKRAPVNGYRPLSYKEAAKPSIVREDENYRDLMEKGSRNLGIAIEEYLKGRDPRTPKDLIWRRANGAEMGAIETAGMPFEPRHTIRVHSVPCIKCGAARGCKHRPAA